MKANVSLRLLGVLGFLLLMAPFYDQCNGKGMKDKVAETTKSTTEVTTVATDTIPNANNENTVVSDSLNALPVEADSKPFYTKAYDLIDNPDNENAFELAGIARIYLDMGFAEFKTEFNKEHAKKNNGILTILQLPIRSFIFVLIVFATFVLMILTFTKKNRWVYKMSIFNTILLFITVILIWFFDPLFETISQIKWGYYTFIIVQIALVIQSRRSLKSAKA